MATVAEIIYDVREMLEQYSDDSDIDNRYILYLYNIKRAKYLRQDLNNFQKSRDNSIMQSFCLSMEKVSSDKCNRDLKCSYILRSKKPIPKPIELHDRVAITRVKPTNRKSLPFTFTTLERAIYYSNSKFPNSIYSFIDTDGHLYVVSNNESHVLIDCIDVTGIFEDPISLKDYKNCCDCKDSNESTCFDEQTSEYPLQPHYIDLIKGEIANDLLNKLQTPQDIINNAKEN